MHVDGEAMNRDEGFVDVLVCMWRKRIQIDNTTVLEAKTSTTENMSRYSITKDTLHHLTWLIGAVISPAGCGPQRLWEREVDESRACEGLEGVSERVVELLRKEEARKRDAQGHVDTTKPCLL